MHLDKVCHRALLVLLPPDQEAGPRPPSEASFPEGLGSDGDGGDADKLRGRGGVEVGLGNQLRHQGEGLSVNADQKLGYFDVWAWGGLGKGLELDRGLGMRLGGWGWDGGKARLLFDPYGLDL